MCAARRGKTEQAVAAVNGAILVARKLVSVAFAGNREDKVSVIAERARYCQLMAAKMRMSALDVSKTILAAWLSALEDKPELIETIVAQHGLRDIVFPEDEDNLPPPAEIIGLVRCYEDLSRQVAAARTDLPVTLKYLRKAWGGTPERQSMTRKFVNVLQDEKFLADLGRAAGRVLVVDPNEAVTPVLSLPLSGEGYEVEVVADVATAKAVVAERRPELIISEVDIPIMDGLELCKWVKGNRETADIAFIMMTSKKGHKIGAHCLREGADEFLKKPVDLEILSLKMERLAVKEKAGAAAEEGVVGGSLSEMEFTDMIQIFCAGNKNMRLDFARGDEEGLICIQGGDIIHAKLGDQTGDRAFYSLMTWKDGTFSAHQWDEFPERSIETSTMSLLMEGARMVDEARAKEQP